jgi:ATP-dependent Clp protease protease subunit
VVGKEESMAKDWVFQDEDDEEAPEKRGSEPSPEEARLVERFLRTRTILVCEAITDTLARRVYQNLLLLENEDPKAPITIIINSPGGEADSGFGIMDMVRFIGCPVRTLVAGLCASAAVLVAVAPDRENRFALPHSRFLLHQPMAASFGQASDLEIASTEILRLRDRYNEVIAKATGQTVEKVTQDSDRDFWMSAPEALEYGLVSRIVERRQEMG